MSGSFVVPPPAPVSSGLVRTHVCLRGVACGHVTALSLLAYENVTYVHTSHRKPTTFHQGRHKLIIVFTSVGAGVAFISKELPGSGEHATHGECGRDERPQAQA